MEWLLIVIVIVASLILLKVLSFVKFMAVRILGLVAGEIAVWRLMLFIQ